MVFLQASAEKAVLPEGVSLGTGDAIFFILLALIFAGPLVLIVWAQNAENFRRRRGSDQRLRRSGWVKSEKRWSRTLDGMLTTVRSYAHNPDAGMMKLEVSIDSGGRVPSPITIRPRALIGRLREHAAHEALELGNRSFDEQFDVNGPVAAALAALRPSLIERLNKQGTRKHRHDRFVDRLEVRRGVVTITYGIGHTWSLASILDGYLEHARSVADALSVRLADVPALLMEDVEGANVRRVGLAMNELLGRFADTAEGSALRDDLDARLHALARECARTDDVGAASLLFQLCRRHLDGPRAAQLIREFIDDPSPEIAREAEQALAGLQAAAGSGHLSEVIVDGAAAGSLSDVADHHSTTGALAEATVAAGSDER